VHSCMAVLGCTIYQNAVKCISKATFTLMESEISRSAAWEHVDKQMYRLLLAALSRLTVPLAGHEQNNITCKGEITVPVSSYTYIITIS